MSSLQDEFNYMQSGQWAERNPLTCPCKGSGWKLSDLDTWHECPYHKHGSTHPEVEMEEPVDPAFRQQEEAARLEMLRRLYREAREAAFTEGFSGSFKDACAGLLHDSEFLARYRIAEDAEITPVMWVAAAEEVAEGAHVDRRAEEAEYPF